MTAKPDHCLISVTFRDQLIAVIASTVLKKTAEMSTADFPKVHQLIGRDTFVEDLITSTDIY